MFGFYTPVLVFQGICVYHAYRNNADSRWYWFILLFPVVGCFFYLYHHFYNRKTVAGIEETVNRIVNSNYRIEQLEKAFKFSDNHTNRINLADAYLEIGRFQDAIDLYKGSLVGFMADDPGVHIKLLQANFFNHNYDEVIRLSNLLANEKSFQQSEQKIAHAWALHFVGKSENAEQVFMSMDKSFTNYAHRMEYCKFLKAMGRTLDMQAKCQELMEELELMKGPERKLYRSYKAEMENLIQSIPAKA